jgi:hypothetical protein
LLEHANRMFIRKPKQKLLMMAKSLTYQLVL